MSAMLNSGRTPEWTGPTVERASCVCGKGRLALNPGYATAPISDACSAGHPADDTTTRLCTPPLHPLLGLRRRV